VNGVEETGVTIMQLDAGMDTGPILHQIPDHVDPDVTGGELSEHLAEVGAQALIETLALLEQGDLRAVPQDDALATLAPKLTREIARIDWSKDAGTIARLIRARSPTRRVDGVGRRGGEALQRSCHRGTRGGGHSTDR